MTVEAQSPAANLEEEVRDLTSYLDGLPPELRAGGAFAAYETRLEGLRQDLALAKWRQLDLPAEPFFKIVQLHRHPERFESDSWRAIRETTLALEEVHLRGMRRYSRVSQVLSAGTLLAATSSVFAALAGPLGAVVGTAGAAALLAAAQLSLHLPERSRREQSTAGLLHFLRSELDLLSRRTRHGPLDQADAAEFSRRIIVLLSEGPSNPSPRDSAPTS